MVSEAFPPFSRDKAHSYNNNTTEWTRVSRKIKSVICLSADLSCFLVFLTADLIFADLAFFLLLCPGKIKSVICLSAQLSSFFRRDPREIQLPAAINQRRNKNNNDVVVPFALPNHLPFRLYRHCAGVITSSPLLVTVPASPPRPCHIPSSLPQTVLRQR